MAPGAVPSAAALILALELRGARRRGGHLARAAGWPTAVAAVLALAAAAAGEARYRWIRHRVLHAEPERLARVGNHLLVGYRDVGEVTGLVQRHAVGGVFVSAWNARGRSAAELAAEVARLQAVRRRAGGAPLGIAADQEAGRCHASRRRSSSCRRSRRLPPRAGSHRSRAARP